MTSSNLCEMKDTHKPHILMLYEKNSRHVIFRKFGVIWDKIITFFIGVARGVRKGRAHPGSTTNKNGIKKKEIKTIGKQRKKGAVVLITANNTFGGPSYIGRCP